MQVQLLQSILSPWERDLSKVLCHHLVIHEVLTSRIKGYGPSTSAGSPTVKNHDNSDNATSNQTAWQLITLVS